LQVFIVPSQIILKQVRTKRKYIMPVVFLSVKAVQNHTYHQDWLGRAAYKINYILTCMGMIVV
jgi:hypothetical protein